MQVYVVYFKCNKQCIREYPNLREYTKELYQMPGIHEAINMEHIKLCALFRCHLPAALYMHRPSLFAHELLSVVCSELAHNGTIPMQPSC